MTHKEQLKIVLSSYELWHENYLNFRESKFTGVVEILNSKTRWFSLKEGRYHCEDGPAFKIIRSNKIIEEWWLNGTLLFSSGVKGYMELLNFKNNLILDKFKHPKYPSVEVYRVLNRKYIYEQCIISGMEKYIVL